MSTTDLAAALRQALAALEHHTEMTRPIQRTTEAIDAARAALAATAAPTVPASEWAMVPVEPTEAMEIAGALAHQQSVAHDHIGPINDAYSAMLAARPAAPAPSEPMSPIEKLGQSIETALDDAPAGDVLKIITGAFVSLTVELVRRAGHDVTKAIQVDGGDQRDITIHAPKE